MTPSIGESIRDMCRAFGQDVHDTLREPDEGVQGLRIALLSEEFREYLEAEKAKDMVERADALADMLVVIYGTAAAYGIDLDAVVWEVQRSNMTKLVDGKVIRRWDGKILKPDTYEPPQIARIIGHEPTA